MQVDGYKMHKWDGDQSFPYIITIFSAPNYCGYYDNKAAVLVMQEGNLSLKQYEEVPVPYRLPDDMDIFTWSVPFLVEKTLSIFFSLVSKVTAEELSDDDENRALELMQEQANAEQRKMQRNAFKVKLKSMTQMMKMYDTLTDER